MSEFALIDVLRARCAQPRDDVALGIGDDAALLQVAPGHQLVACTDTMVAGVHFLPDTAPADIGWKALAVNLSDVAAMGAAPAWALLALTLPDSDARFVEAFADGLAELARMHEVALVGGDTTEGPLAITVTVLGSVPAGQALTRAGARAGDTVYVTGTLGDAAGALRWLGGSGKNHPPQSPFVPKGEAEAHRLRNEEGRREAPGGRRSAKEKPEAGRQEPVDWLLARLQRPEPRIAAGLALRGIASACIDVSDGLLADLGHVCTASGVAAELDADALPVSQALRDTFDSDACRDLALAGGDDYELCFTVPAAREAEIVVAFDRVGCRTTRIGCIVGGSGIRVTDARGRTIRTPRVGWEHFSR